MPARGPRTPGAQHADPPWDAAVSDAEYILEAQLGHLQPEGGHAAMTVEAAPYGRMLPDIRAVRLAVLRVEAKFKYDDHKPVGHRERVTARLEERDHGLDRGAAAQQRRRLAAIGDWQARSGER